MNDEDIARLWDHYTASLTRVRWVQHIAMADTITRAADDVDHIAKRLKEIAEERAEAKHQSDPVYATGDNLDRVAIDWGEKRNLAESDYTFRQRLLKKIRGD